MAAMLHVANTQEEAFTGALEEWQELRKTVISWASAEFPEVEGYLCWAEGQGRPIESEQVTSAGLGPLAGTFNQQVRREL